MMILFLISKCKFNIFNGIGSFLTDFFNNLTGLSMRLGIEKAFARALF